MRLFQVAVMRIELVCLILIFSLYAEVAAQQAVLKKRLSFEADNQRLEDVLLNLAEAGGFSFAYNPDMLPVDSLVSLNVENTSLKILLNQLLGRQLEYKISGNLLVILKTKYSGDRHTETAAGKKNYTIDGYLQNAYTGEYVGQTTVFDVGGLRSTTTDSAGYFSLEIPAKEEVIAIGVASNKFEETAVVLINRDQNLNIPVIPLKGINDRPQSGTGDGSAMVNKLKVVRFVAPASDLEQSGSLYVKNYRFAQASFVPFVGTNLKMSGTVENKLSLNVLAGYNGATRGLELGGLMNINRFHSHGAQIAGIGNVVGTETGGVQFAGIFNTNFGTVRGLQVAGINNLVLDSLRGVQVAGINNTITGSTDGVQVAGINNLARNDLNGIQIAGVSNVTMRDVHKLQVAGVVNFGADITGVQIAGVINSSYGQVKGLQLAGVMNIAADTLSGQQVASIVNFARHNNGFQLGLVNIGYAATGTSLGLLNLFWRGYHRLEVFGNEVLPMNARVKFGTRKFYNAIGFGTNGFASGNVWGYSYGFGTVIPLGEKQHHLNIDLSATDLQNDDTWVETMNLNVRLGVLYGFRINRRFIIYGGPVWSHFIFDPDHLAEQPFIDDVAPYELYSTHLGDDVVQSWVGFELGVRLR